MLRRRANDSAAKEVAAGLIMLIASRERALAGGEGRPWVGVGVGIDQIIRGTTCLLLT